MGLFGSLFGAGKQDINALYQEAQQTEGALIVDVRSPGEFAQGHLPKAHNVPGGDPARIAQLAGGKDTPLYVYCLSGARAGNALRGLRQAGFTQVVNMGGINRWQGATE